MKIRDRGKECNFVIASGFLWEIRKLTYRKAEGGKVLYLVMLKSSDTIAESWTLAYACYKSCWWFFHLPDYIGLAFLRETYSENLSPLLFPPLTHSRILYNNLYLPMSLSTSLPFQANAAYKR